MSTELKTKNPGRSLNRRALISGVTVASVGLAGSGHAGAADSNRSHNLALKQEDGPELIVGLNVDPTTLDLLDNTNAAFQCVSAAIVEQFIIFDTETLEPTPWLAESWEWLDDQTLQLKVKEGIFFTNGEPLDAESARVSLDRLLTSDSYSFFLKEGVYEQVEVVDDMTVNVKLTEPYAPLVAVIARGGSAVPPIYYQEVGTEGFGQKPIGTGPFVLSEWAKDDHITLTRNSDYRNGAHPLGTVRFRIFPEDTARVAALQAGEIHLALSVPVNGLRQIESTDGISAVSVPSLRKFSTFFDSISADKDAFSDVRVRKAVNMAVDKVAITDSLLEGAGTPLPGQWQTEGEPGYNPEISMIEYDPEGARALLEEAGFGDGLDFQLTYTVGRYPQDRELGEIVASYLEQVGISVTQRPVEYGAFATARQEETIGTHQWGLLYPPDAVFNFRTFVRDSPYEYHALPDEFTTLVDQASQETDLEAQKDLFMRVSEIMDEEVPQLLLHAPNDNYGVSDKVQGFTPRRDQVLWLFDVSLSE